MTIFEEYLDHLDPKVRRRAIDWRCSIGLQDVDGLLVSDFLIEQARRNIGSEITVDEVQQLIDKQILQKKETGKTSTEIVI